MTKDIYEILEIKPQKEKEDIDKKTKRANNLAVTSFVMAILGLISTGLSLYRLSEDSAWIFTPYYLVPVFQIADYSSMFVPPLSLIIGVSALLYSARNPKTTRKKFAIIGIIIPLFLYPIYWFNVIRLAFESMA